jgi:hypothetical protein
MWHRENLKSYINNFCLDLVCVFHVFVSVTRATYSKSFNFQNLIFNI